MTELERAAYDVRVAIRLLRMRRTRLERVRDARLYALGATVAPDMRLAVEHALFPRRCATRLDSKARVR